MVNLLPDSGGRRGKRVWGLARPITHSVKPGRSLSSGPRPMLACTAAITTRPLARLEFRGAPVRRQSSRPSHNPELAHRLWDVSGQLTGVIYPL